MAEHHARQGLDLDILQRGALDLGEIADLGLREFDVGDRLRRDLGDERRGSRRRRAESSAATICRSARTARAPPRRRAWRVRYPGLPGDPGHQTAAAQIGPASAKPWLAFEVADAPTADRLCDAVHIIVHATSLGGVESTIERRSKLPGQEHVPPGLLRRSTGCEHIDDLWNDLNTALGQATRLGNPA